MDSPKVLRILRRQIWNADGSLTNASELTQDQNRRRARISFPRPASNVESSDNWLDDTLHQVSIMLIDGGNLDSLYNRILDAAVVLMSSDMASMQSLDPERNRFRLLAWKGFHPQSARFWEWVYLDSASTCGLALFSGGRVVVPDV